MRKTSLLAAMGLICLVVPNVYGMFCMPELIPGDRIINNTSLALKEEPENPRLYFILARTHYLMFYNKSFDVLAYDRDASIEAAPDHLQFDFASRALLERAEELTLKEMGFDSFKNIPEGSWDEYSRIYEQKRKQLEVSNYKPDALSNSDIMFHANSSFENFSKAIELDNDEALYHLGLASLLEQYVSYLNEIKSEMVPEQFQNIILESARQSYCKAYKLAVTSDLKHKCRPIEGLSGLISYESGNGYIRLSKKIGSISKDELKTVREVEKNVARLTKLPIGAITPIIFSLKDSSKMSDLLLNDFKVDYDLDGNGAAERRSWVKPDTAYLVWDPGNTGKITSGRQMFGSVTWRLLFDNGYNALDVLDDDRNAVLSGNELIGLSAWFDTNSNGISEPGEVVPITSLGIAEISTHFTGYDTGCTKNSAGIKTIDGTFLPTYDWISK